MNFTNVFLDDFIKTTPSFEELTLVSFFKVKSYCELSGLCMGPQSLNQNIFPVNV